MKAGMAPADARGTWLLAANLPSSQRDCFSG